MAADEVDAHLEGCPSCRQWQAEATVLTRTLRVRRVEQTPDLVDTVVSRVPRRRNTALRIAIGVVAIAQLALGLTQAFGSAQHVHGGTTAGHLFNESTSWNIAIGIGLGWAAFRDRFAAGLLPTLGAFVLVLLGFSAHDLVTGAVGAGRLASHGLVVIGTGLLFAVHRWRDGERDPGPGAATTAEAADVVATAEVPAPTPKRLRKRSGTLRPSAYRHVA